MNVFEIFQDLSVNIWTYGGAFILVLGVLVFVHEWGHYIVARLCGVKVETFSIGFGREIAGFQDRHGTRWKIALIPLGGYVKLFGDVDPETVKLEAGEEPLKPLSPAEREEAFFNKPLWKRAAVVFAGPAINYIFAIFLFSLLFIFNGQPVTPPSAAAVIGGSAAEQYGFKPHDLIVSIDNKPTRSFEDIRREMMISLDDERHFVIEREGQLIDIYAKPKKIEEEDRFGFKHTRGLLGLIGPQHAIRVSTIKAVDGVAYDTPEALRAVLLARAGTPFVIDLKQPWGKEDRFTVHPSRAQNEGLADPDSEHYDVLFIAHETEQKVVHYGPFEAVSKAAQEAVEVTLGTLEALGQIVTGTRSATELGGLIRIGALAGDMAQQGVVALLFFAALLSINLGLINLFPIPMLDGGHLVFYAVEALIGRPVPDRIQEYAFRAGFVFLIGLMAFANLNDIMQLIL